MDYISIDYSEQRSYMVVNEGRGKVYRIGRMPMSFEALPDMQSCF